MKSKEPFDRVSAAVSESRLWRRHVDMGQIGATPRGGVNRLALTIEDALAQTQLLQWASARGYTASRDEIGNLFIRRKGTDATADAVLTGSHLDSQPTGGKYDGAYGVLAGFEVLEALDDAGIETVRPIEVVAWMNEEGSRFSPGAMGSAVFTGSASLDEMQGKTDRKGISVRDALAETAKRCPVPSRRLGEVKPAAYVEAHIEQGPRLESAKATIGVVLSIQGSRRFLVAIFGEEAHAGTTPRRHRKDAVSAAVAAISALESLTADAHDTLRFTVGCLDVYPSSPNTVAGKVTFTIDLRHPDEATLTDIGDRIHTTVKEAAALRSCTAEITNVSYVKPITFAPHVVDRVRAAARDEGYPSMDLPSGAGHDAMHLSRICPAAMVFVPCLRGVSHNEAESATPEDLAAGTRVLARVILELAG
jgi:beta-ureidopropionase / N-carbamoyl-L-amino-acid hydrolase